MEDIMDNLKFNFSLEQVNAILFALGRMPYENVFQLIEEVKRQANEQLPQPPNTTFKEE
jgi:hypothetical protein